MGNEREGRARGRARAGARVWAGAPVAAYEIARKEANEVRAVLGRFVIKVILTEPQISHAYDLNGACMGMLTHAIIAMERRPEK